MEVYTKEYVEEMENYYINMIAQQSMAIANLRGQLAEARKEKEDAGNAESGT